MIQRYQQKYLINHRDVLESFVVVVAVVIVVVLASVMEKGLQFLNKDHSLLGLMMNITQPCSILLSLHVSTISYGTF